MTASPATAALEHKLATIVGAEFVSAEPIAIDGVVAGVAVAPGSPEEVAAVLRLAWENELVVVPAGGCTRMGLGGIPERVDILLRTQRLNQVEKYDPGDLTISVGAGLTVAELQQTLAAHRQFLPLDPAQPARATVGGSLASAAHGPLKHLYGGAREFCVGIKFATADGKLAKGGGHVVKNVAGYDLMKLLIGSFGTLGVIVSANFKLFPQPRQTRTFEAEFASVEEAIRFRDRVVNSALTPMCLEIASPAAGMFLDTAGASPWRVFLRAGGSDAVLARYRAELGSAVSRETADAAETQLWRAFSDFADTVLAQQQCAMVMQISVPPSDAAEALAAAERAAAEQGFAGAVIGRVAVGSLLAAFIPFGGELPSTMQYANAASALRSALPRDGAAVVAACPTEAKRHFDVWGSTPTDRGAMRAVKRALDEKNILSRGRFLV
jgi:glycolate oxidase FAD binding subunit